MQQRTAGVNPSEESIKIGPLGIRFLLTGDDSNGSVSPFEVLVPVGEKLAAPADENDAIFPPFTLADVPVAGACPPEGWK